MKIDDIRNVLIVGAGVMGRQIGLQCAMYGYNVVIYDISPSALQEAEGSIKKYAEFLIGQRRLTTDDAEASIKRISMTADSEEASASVHLLIEAVPEILELKQKVFALFNELCPANTIFTTNTSSMVISMLVSATGRPSSFAALHFNHYVWDTGIVEIMPHPKTSGETLSLLEAFALRIGLAPLLLKKESPSYISNALLNAVNSAALSLVSGGVALSEDVDRVWMSITNMNMGPFGSMDFIGLDVAYHVTQYWANVFRNPAMQANAKLLKGFVDKGHLGVKSGQGFYSYPDPAYKQQGFLPCNNIKTAQSSADIHGKTKPQ